MADTPENVGDQLLARGCRQGALLDAPVRILWLRAGADSWSLGEEVHPEARFVVASQDCDIAAREDSEPFVEAMLVARTVDRGLIHEAKKGNSSRRFLLKSEGEVGLVADGCKRVLVEKRALLAATFTPAFAAEDRKSPRRFADWLAGRYSRPAIPNDHVLAVHRPVVRAVEKADKEMRRRLDAVDEILFRVRAGAKPYIVDFVLLTDGVPLDPEDEAELCGWLEDAVLSADLVAKIYIASRTPVTISLGDYLEMTRLELDRFSAG